MSASSKIKSIVLAATGVVVAAGSVIGGTLRPTTEDLDTLSNGCSIIGKETNADSDKAKENKHKNRYDTLSAEDVNPNATLDALSKAAGKEAFSEDQGAEVEGTVVDVKLGGVESCNCQEKKDHSLMDTHIFVGPLGSTVNTPKDQCIVVEVTPRVRELMAEQGIDWSTTTLTKALTGKNVRVSGWLFFDADHMNASVADHGKLAKPWRASCWEIHPVTELQVVDGLKPQGTGAPAGGAPGNPPTNSNPSH